VKVRAKGPYLETEDFGLNEVQRFAIDFDKTLSILNTLSAISWGFDVLVVVESYLAVGDRGCYFKVSAETVASNPPRTYQFASCQSTAHSA
jgi:hypothetical protein